MMTRVFAIDVGNPLRKLILLKLADQANDDGECWPSYQRIADACECSRSTVKTHVRELEKAGLLRREFRRTEGLNRSNIFRLTIKKDGASADRGRAGTDPVRAGAALGGGAGAAPGGAEADPRTSHITSHSSESVKESGAGAKISPPPNVSHQSWKDYLDHRKAKRAPVTQRAAELIGKKLASLSPSEADRCLELSIENGWTGVFPERSRPNSGRGRPTETPRERAIRMAGERGIPYDPK